MWNPSVIMFLQFCGYSNDDKAAMIWASNGNSIIRQYYTPDFFLTKNLEKLKIEIFEVFRQSYNGYGQQYPVVHPSSFKV